MNGEHYQAMITILLLSKTEELYMAGNGPLQTLRSTDLTVGYVEDHVYEANPEKDEDNIEEFIRNIAGDMLYSTPELNPAYQLCEEAQKQSTFT